MRYGIWDGIWDLGYGMGYGIWDMGWDLGFGIWDGLWDLGLGYGCMGLGYDTNGIWDFPKSHSMGGKYRTRDGDRLESRDLSSFLNRPQLLNSEFIWLKILLE